MQPRTNIRDASHGCNVSAEEGTSSAPYESSFGGRSYYPTSIFKRRCSSVPPRGEHINTRPESKETFMQVNARESSQGKVYIKAHNAVTTKISPLLSRYKETGKKVTSHNAKNSTHTIASAMPSENNISTSNQRGQKQRVSVSCPPAPRHSPSAERKISTTVEREIDLNVQQTCPDKACIHSRQFILEFITLRHELRECSAALHDREVELEELRSQFHLIQREKTDVESHFQIEKRAIETKCMRDVERAQEEWLGRESEWQQRFEDLTIALEQEREDHSKTYNELESIKSLYLPAKERLDWIYDTFGFAASDQTKKDAEEVFSVVRNLPMNDTQSPDKHSATSFLETPTPRRRPPPIPEPSQVERAFFGINEEITSRIPASFPPHTYQANTVDSTIINISDPSINPCDISQNNSIHVDDTDVVGSRFYRKNDEDEMDGTTQRETDEGTTEGEGRASSGDQRSNAHVTSMLSSTQVKPFEGCIVSPSYANSTLQSMTGHDALFCKELLRALLDKEKQLTELAVERTTLKEKLAKLSD